MIPRSHNQLGYKLVKTKEELDEAMYHPPIIEDDNTYQWVMTQAFIDLQLKRLKREHEKLDREAEKLRLNV